MEKFIHQTVRNLKGKNRAKLMSSKPQKCLSVNRNKKLMVSSQFVLNYQPSAIKLPISASGQRQSRSQWIET